MARMIGDNKERRCAVSERYGSACCRCGACCLSCACARAAEASPGAGAGPCPFLSFDDSDAAVCTLAGPSPSPDVKRSFGFGVGCCMRGRVRDRRGKWYQWADLPDDVKRSLAAGMRSGAVACG